MINLIKREAWAYLRLGLMTPASKQAKSASKETADFGVVFVPGVGANASQFLALKAALETTVEWFDAFEYNWFGDLRNNAVLLSRYLDRAGRRCRRLLVVGHSLGGLLLRIALQTEPAPRSVVGYCAICSPLHGTWRSRVAPSARLRQLRPDAPLMQEVLRTAHRLDRLRGGVLTIGARRDQFIQPFDSALIEGHPTLLLETEGHAASLFSPLVHDRIRELAHHLS